MSKKNQKQHRLVLAVLILFLIPFVFSTTVMAAKPVSTFTSKKISTAKKKTAKMSSTIPSISDISVEDRKKIDQLPLGRAVKIKVHGHETWGVKVKTTGGYYILNDDEEENSDKAKKGDSTELNQNAPPLGEEFENETSVSGNVNLKNVSAFESFDPSFYGTAPDSHPECRTTSLPVEITLDESLFGPVRDQSPGNSSRGTCTAQAMANVATYVWNDAQGDSKYFSANWIHMRVNEYEIVTGQETMDNLITGGGINDYRDLNMTAFGGFMEESDFPYENPLWNLRGQSLYVDTLLAPYTARYNNVTRIPPVCHFPTRPEYQAHVEKVEIYDSQAPLDFVKIKLCQNRPVYASFDYFDGMLSNSSIQNNDYVLEAPEEYESTGGHVMTILGYDDDTQRLRVLNSWGDDWGDNGYFYMTYEAFLTLRRDYMLTIHEIRPYLSRRPILYESLTTTPLPDCGMM